MELAGEKSPPKDPYVTEKGDSCKATSEFIAFQKAAGESNTANSSNKK